MDELGEAEREPLEGHRPLSFEAFFAKAFPRVRRMAARIVGFGPAEDVAVEALARAYARWPAVAAMERPEAWVMRVAANLAFNQVARKRAWVPETPSPDAADAVVLRQALVEALRRLPRRQREAVVLRYIADQTDQDIAQALGLSSGTVKTHLRRALPRLQSLLAADDDPTCARRLP